jgi:uncharacterized protein YyaL (SSP411 family)
VNRLAQESSPYLRQHAGNPVDWYPWGDEAFARARADDRPVLLSVGYSACHWCHVMAHESFEDAATASVMNDLFVNVKVDREERPDVDAIYMEAVMALSGSGGWPMTVFLAPDGRPFFAGTYFPKRSMGGRPGFVDLLRAVDEAWADKREDLLQQADQLTEAVRARTAVEASSAVGREVIDAAVEGLAQVHDPEWGGFGRAPKFPMTGNLELLLRLYARDRDAAKWAIIETTLDAMASGGIYDHLGGGFHRYSVDAFWMVPHFEKMLYDNALIPRAYLRAWQLSGEPRFRQVVEETIGYVVRDLRQADGGFSSAEDADSEGEEGRFYVWRFEELDPVAAAWYGATKSGNFEGRNILHRPIRGDVLRPAEVEAARAALFETRGHRVRPGLDDKVLTEWNAMFVATLAEAGAAMGRSDWIAIATETMTALTSRARVDGRWRRVAGGAQPAFAGDYAHLIDACTRLSEATGARRWIDEACVAADAMLDLFEDDAEGGGLWTTGRDGEELLVRTKDVFDGAIPSANSTAALALARLAALTGSERYARAARACLPNAYLRHQPTAFTTALGALDVMLTGATEVVISGDRPDLVAAAQRPYLPNAVLAWGEPYDSPLWEGRAAEAAYVCRDFVCQLPVTTSEQLSAQLVP